MNRYDLIRAVLSQSLSPNVVQAFDALAELERMAGEVVAYQYLHHYNGSESWMPYIFVNGHESKVSRPLYAAPPIPAPPIPKGMFTADEMEAAYRAGRQDGRSIPLNADDSWLTSQTRQFVKERTA